MIWVQIAMRMNPRSSAAVNMLGTCLTSQGRLQDGIDAYTKALDLDPTVPDARTNMAVAHKEASLLPCS
jgi:Flp pilus assembly protein TadD